MNSNRPSLAFLFLCSHAFAQWSADELDSGPAPTSSQVAGLGGAAPGFPGQTLYVHDLAGNLYRVDDYATHPVAVWITHTGVGRMADIAVDAQGELFSCRLHHYPITEFYDHDASFQGTPVGSSPALLWGNALDIDASGTAWARSGNSTGLWQVSTATGAPVQVAFMPGFAAGDIAVDRDGALLTVDALGRIDRYHPATGQISVLGFHGLGPAIWGFEIDVDGAAYLFSSDGRAFALDLDTLQTTFLGDLGIQVAGCAFVRSADDVSSVGVSYCGPAVANSSGSPACIEALGAASIPASDLTLVATELPPNTMGWFLRSPHRGFTPFVRGSGSLCLGPPLAFAASAPTSVNPSGTAWLPLDLVQLGVQPGDTLRFQFWYRDPLPSPTTNFTDALALTFE